MSLTQSLKAESESFSLRDTTLAIEYIKIAESFSKAAQYDSSNFYYEKAKNIFDMVYIENDNPEFLRKSLNCENKIGWNLFILGDFNFAKERLQKTLDFTIEKIGEDFIEVSHSYQILGEFYAKQGYYRKSIDHHKKSMATKINLLGEGNPQLVSNYNSLGINFFELGDYDRSLNYYQKGVDLLLLLQNINELTIAKFYNNIGNVYDKKSDYNKSLEFLNKSLSIKIKLLGEDHLDVSSSYVNIGTVYSNKKNYFNGLENLYKSLEIKLKVLGQSHPEIAKNYGNIADSYYYLKDYNKAIEYSNKSIEMMISTMDENNPVLINRYITLGNILKDNSDFDGSLRNFEKALSLGITSFGIKHPAVGKCYASLAEVYYSMGDLQEALVSCQKSLISLVKEFNEESTHSNPELVGILSELELLNTLQLKARIVSHMTDTPDIYKLELTFTTYQRAIELIDKMRTGYKAEGSKLFLGERSAEIYEGAIISSIKLFEQTEDIKYKESAYIIVEKRKSAVLKESLNEVQVKQFSKLPVDLLEEEKQLKIDLAFYDTRLQKEYSKKGTKDTLLIKEYENLLFDLKARYENLIAKYETEFPDYYNLKYQTKTITVEQVQQQMQNNTVLVEYFVGDSSVHIITISKDEFEVSTIRKTDDLPSAVNSFYSSIVKSNTEDYIKYGNLLSEILIRPVLKRANDIEKLVIIPHDMLYKIPYEALFTSVQNTSQKDYTKINFLVKDFNISYHYSSALYINSLKSELTEDKERKKNFGGFAPVFPDNYLSGYTLTSNALDYLAYDSDEIFRSVTIDGKKFNELKHSEWEVKSIVELFAQRGKGKQSLGYFYSDATEEKFKESIIDYSIVHIATHSFINETHPQISGIVFAQPDTNYYSTEDGILYAGEIYNLDLNADLVVLSSCESGLGLLIKGEGMMALTRGFLYSGANNVLFSLWKVPDKPTSELMVEFYKNILSGKSYSQSLREAKLSLIKNSLTSRPRSWASFILIGGD